MNDDDTRRLNMLSAEYSNLALRMLKLEQQITRKEQHTYTMVLSCSIPFTIVASSSTEALDDARDIVMNSKGSELPGFTIQVQGRVIEL